MANEIYNTSWWGTALDTARTAGTNPDFFGSQFKLLTSEQDNLVVNGDFATDSDWTKGTGWSIGSGVASCDGTQTANSNFYQPITWQTAIYKQTITVSMSSGTLLLYGGNTNHSISITSSGTYVFYTDVSLSGNIYDIYIQANSSFIGSIDNVSVQLVRADEVEAKKCLADWIHTTALKDLNN